MVDPSMVDPYKIRIRPKQPLTNILRNWTWPSKSAVQRNPATAHPDLDAKFTIWCPLVKDGQRILLTDLPTELLLMIMEYIRERRFQQALAIAFSDCPYFMLPLLKHCQLSDSSQDRLDSLSINEILSFLHKHPGYASEVRSITYRYHYCATARYTKKTLDDLSVRPLQAAEYQSLVRTAGMGSNVSLLHSLIDGNQLAGFALLVVLSTKVRNVHLRIHSQAWCDLQHIAEDAILPIADCFSSQHRSLDGLSITKLPGQDGEELFDRNLVPLVSAAFSIQALKNLMLSNFIESVCYPGQWLEEEELTNIEKITLHECQHSSRFIPRLLRQVTGLTSFECVLFHGTKLDEGSGAQPLTELNGCTFSSGLQPHRDTLVNLRVVSSRDLNEENWSPSHRPPIRNPIESLQDFHRLKRLETSPGILLTEASWRGDHNWWLSNILPASIHNMVFTYVTFKMQSYLKKLAAHLSATNKAAFPDLKHIIDASNLTLLKSKWPANFRSGLRPGFFQELSRVGVKTYPDGADFGIAYTYSLDPAPRKGSGFKRLLPLEPPPHSQCMGDCHE